MFATTKTGIEKEINTRYKPIIWKKNVRINKIATNIIMIAKYIHLFFMERKKGKTKTQKYITNNKSK
jgi:hypothetical protein